MNRNILLIVLLSISSLLFSQNKLKISVFANPCINWINSDNSNTETASPTIGFDAGLMVDKFFAERYAVSTGASIGSFGGEMKIDGFEKHRYNINYISFPLGLKLKTKEIGYFTYYANLGFLAQINYRATDYYNTETHNVWDNTKLFNLGYHFGLGTEYGLGGDAALILGLKYSNGFLDIINNRDGVQSISSMAVVLGILF